MRWTLLRGEDHKKPKQQHDKSNHPARNALEDRPKTLANTSLWQVWLKSLSLMIYIQKRSVEQAIVFMSGTNSTPSQNKQNNERITFPRNTQVCPRRQQVPSIVTLWIKSKPSHETQPISQADRSGQLSASTRADEQSTELYESNWSGFLATHLVKHPIKTGQPSRRN